MTNKHKKRVVKEVDLFLDGILYAVQHLVLEQHEDSSAKFIVQDCGLPIEEFIATQKKTHYGNREMLKFFHSLLTTKQNKKRKS